MADIFNPCFDKFTFFDSEADSIFEKNFTDTFKVKEYCVKLTTQEKNAINNGADAKSSLVY